jgi:hypothetical protein
METEKTLVVRTEDFQMLLTAVLMVHEYHEQGTLTGEHIDLMGAVLHILINHSVGDVM